MIGYYDSLVDHSRLKFIYTNLIYCKRHFLFFIFLSQDYNFFINYRVE